MNSGIRLGDIAHARAGDKGDSSILFLAPFRPEDLQAVRDAATGPRLASHFNVADESTIVISCLQDLAAMCIVIPHRLDGGVTRSASADPHGKTLSAHLLELVID